MAAQNMLMLPVKVDATNALQIIIEAVVSNPVSTGFSSPSPLPQLPVVTDSSNRLVVTFA